MRFRFFILPFVFFLTVSLSVWWYIDPTMAPWILGVLLLGYVGAAWWLDAERPDWWRFAVTPWLMATSILLFSLLLSTGWPIFCLIALLCILEVIYWRYVLTYTDATAVYTPFTLERLSFNLNFLVVFFLAAAIYGFRTFLDISFWITWPVFAVCLAFLISQRLWIAHSQRGATWRLALSLGVSTLEVFILGSFLPFDFRILAFLVAAAYYGLVAMGSEQTETKAIRFNLRLLLIILVLGCLAVLATARWY